MAVSGELKRLKVGRKECLATVIARYTGEQGSGSLEDRGHRDADVDVATSGGSGRQAHAVGGLIGDVLHEEADADGPEAGRSDRVEDMVKGAQDRGDGGAEVHPFLVTAFEVARLAWGAISLTR